MTDPTATIGITIGLVVFLIIILIVLLRKYNEQPITYYNKQTSTFTVTDVYVFRQGDRIRCLNFNGDQYELFQITGVNPKTNEITVHKIPNNCND